jgi:DNA-binding LytR/AlgR family response regulator
VFKSHAADAVKATADDYFFIKCEYKYEKIFFEDILYVQGLENYVTIHTRKGKYVTLLYLKNVEENLDPQLFIRVHKSFIVSISRIDTIENNDIIIQATRIPISRNYRDDVIERVINKSLWKTPGKT